MRAARVEQVEEEERTIRWARPGTLDEVWEQFEDEAVPFHEVIYSLQAEERERAKGGKATK